jgi:hypothetical protein
MNTWDIWIFLPSITLRVAWSLTYIGNSYLFLLKTELQATIVGATLQEFVEDEEKKEEAEKEARAKEKARRREAENRQV